ncbi:T-cell activation Rho GTPase-activating protein-like isoform X4 [Neopsephotus bourkii]|uniref:T-cell activation Rho GTPase-activating protein-like isoform X4 n=1 Tax=Neopsephotus bourkii TaxID=309878 RepID=UPI002AA51B80|nr:T-cell activation Rho GTPase-activating protein-like isoform X4 [Neopsephotus bourkii]
MALCFDSLGSRQVLQEQDEAALAICTARDLSCTRGARAIRLCLHGSSLWHPQGDLCSQDGMLPQPIQDLLALLSEHRPSTEGICWQAANERATHKVREALNSGVEVHLESQPVLLLLAVLLKGLLRKIPSKLLDGQLYEEWMSAMQKTSRQERLAALRE